jgi:hypothetical protein
MAKSDKVVRAWASRTTWCSISACAAFIDFWMVFSSYLQFCDWFDS